MHRLGLFDIQLAAILRAGAGTSNASFNLGGSLLTAIYEQADAARLQGLPGDPHAAVRECHPRRHGDRAGLRWSQR